MKLSLIRACNEEAQHIERLWVGIRTQTLAPWWRLPDLRGAECDSAMAREVFEATGRRRIANATPGTALRMFKQVAQEEALTERAPATAGGRSKAPLHPVRCG
jgi:hypothetical protein